MPHIPGHTINTTSMTFSISDEHKWDLISSLQFVLLKSLSKDGKCTKRELLSAIGKLSFACKVIPAGRIFLCRLVNKSCLVSCLHHWVSLTKEANLDIYWRRNCLPQWSGHSRILQTKWTASPSIKLFTDASSTHGWGAYWDGRWV